MTAWDPKDIPKELRQRWSGMLFSEALAELFEYYNMEEVRLPENRLHKIYFVNKPQQPEPLVITPARRNDQ